MKQFFQQYILRSRYTLLLSVVVIYVLVLVIEGAITGREARLVDFENPFFDLNLNNLEEFNNSRESSSR
ncbi:MAG: hypothetical protein QGG67_12130 [Gammaproteobacteria bacterium]|jgi:hypothetical protein|nr:hypothetical protein [Gammaproteobacteria bacterium]MDP6096710.1 hypothetical protein [Gammaproteobacteria bacterium]MDP7455022.1 hypothetical protein [Gammaproteobacteria bacterium]|tara:strand:+ start:546 stop:752 length:207 start_codon:yes stop_codon:yes gene_type:complete